jgi:transcription elongation GreA/GreB family factor
VKEPLGEALLGASLDEQIVVQVGNRRRTALVEKVEKARAMVAE